MKKQTLGMMISTLRKENGMTQLELAEKMGVTDKAVSKWERDLSFPDINSIPKLAEIFEVTVDELMQVKTETKENMEKKFPSWDSFKAKYPSEQLQRDRFEDLARALFCDRYDIKYGIFQCYNHAGNETNTVNDGEDVVGFNAKFFN